MLVSALLSFALTGCDAVLPPDLSDEVAAIEAENTDLSERVTSLEERVTALEPPVEPAQPAPEPVAPAVVSRPAPRPAPAPDPEPERPAFPDYPHGTLQIATAQKGLAIEIDHEPTEFVTPALIHLPPGSYTLKIEGFPRREVEIELNETTMVVPR